MRLRFGLLLGGALGYLFGTRAGRERYEQLRSTYESVRNSETVGSLTDKAKAKSEEFVDKAKDAKENVVAKANETKESVVGKSQEMKDNVMSKGHEVKDSVTGKSEPPKDPFGN